jgi:hypothetical protein
MIRPAPGRDVAVIGFDNIPEANSMSGAHNRRHRRAAVRSLPH